MSPDRRYDVLLSTLGDDKREEGAPLSSLDRTAAPWESSTQATCECLSWRGALDNLERRHAEDDLGERTYAQFPVHTRSLIVTTHSLLDRGVITEHELRTKMDEVRTRLHRA